MFGLSVFGLRCALLAPRDMIVFAVEGASFAPGVPMTPEVAVAAAEVAGRIVAEVARFQRKSDKPTADVGRVAFLEFWR